MAKLKILLEIKDANSPKEALGLAQEVIAMLKSRLPNTEIEGTVKLLCPDCGQPMQVQDREIVCLACVEAWEREFRLDDRIKEIARRQPEQSLEATVM